MKFNQQWENFNVTQKCSKNPKLGGWVIHQRSQYRLLKSGKSSFISDEIIAQLENLGFQWNYYNQFSLKIACNEMF